MARALALFLLAISLTTALPAARPAAAAAALPPSPQEQGGAVLDAYGGVHPFGGLQLDTSGAAYWAGWDIARALVVRGDGTGGWQLDGFGGIHAFGGAPAIDGPFSAPGWDIARALVVTSHGADGQLDGREGYVLDGFGGLHPFGGAPPLDGLPSWPGEDRARGLEVHVGPDGRPDGGWVMDRTGQVHAFGAAPRLAATAPNPSADAFRQLHRAGGGLAMVGRFGVVVPLGEVGAPHWQGYTDWGSADLTRDVVLLATGGPPPAPQPVSPDAARSFAALIDPLPPYRSSRATYYGPGLFGNTTACGQQLTPALLGVAHRTLPCGQLVEFEHHGRVLTVPVVDRGPFANGADWDLTQATCRALSSPGHDRCSTGPVNWRLAR